MASTSVSTHDHYNVILLGKTGSGISASGNTILGKKGFISKKTFKSVTQDVQQETTIFHEVTLNVYDTPGLFNTETKTNNETILGKWQSLLQQDERTCTVILWVMKVDRFTLEDKEAVPLIEEFIPERLFRNSWILFTRGDELKRDELTIEQFIEDTKELKSLVQRFQYRYHVFDNLCQSPDQVQKLIKKIKKAARIISSETPDPENLLHRRIMLLGKTGVGKSSTGNTILREKIFREGLSSSSITSKCEMHHRVVSGRIVSVIDTPGLFDTRLSREELSVEIGKSVYVSSPGPHAFLYIQPINIRFTEQEKDTIQKLEKIFGKEMKKYTIILFTYGDQLEGKSVDQLIQENRSLQTLMEECGGRYHIFNNKQRNREQVSVLLQKIDRMVEENGGSYYTEEIYQEAERIGRNTERGDSEGFKEFYANNKRFFLGAAAVGGGVVLTGTVIGAVVGGAVGGPVGAGIGAGIGTGIGAVVGGAGFGVGTALYRKAKKKNQTARNQNREIESAPDSDGEYESLDLENMSLDEKSKLLNGKKSQ